MSRKNRRQSPPDILDAPPARRAPASPLRPKTENQKQYLNQLQHKELIFGSGPAGCGKTYIATRVACEMLELGQIEKIIVTRPMVTSGEDPGLLPGKLDAKFDPYLKPVRDVLEEHFRGPSHVNNMIKNGKIEIAPIAFLRGHTFKNCFVLLDEAQNTSLGQMKLFLTRIGNGARTCICGDPEQVDIKGPNGLTDALYRFGGLPEVGATRFTDADVVRSGLAKKIVQGYK